MLIALLLLLTFIVYVGYEREVTYNTTYYGPAGFIREGMETLRPQTTYMEGGCYPYNKSTHVPTGGSQSRIIFNYWANKALSEEMRKTHEEWMQQREHPVPHDICG